jgi:hypothetical protein
MEYVGKVDACKEPEGDQIDATDCQSTQRSDFFWSKKCASYGVERKDEIANDVVYFHSGAPRIAAVVLCPEIYKPSPRFTNGGRMLTRLAARAERSSVLRQ